MFRCRIFQLLLVVLAAVTVAHALGMDRMMDAQRRGIVMKRQETGDGGPDVTGNAEPTDDPPDPTPTPEPTDEPTEEPTTESTPTEDTDVETTAPKTTARTTTPTTREDEPTPDPTSSKEEEEEEEDEPTPTPTVETRIETITTTDSNGQVNTFTSESTTTRTPGLSADDGGASSGMSTSTRNTVIGVVVGVGGAIVLGALGFVAWRIWGKKKHAEEHDTLMNYNTGYAGVEKTEPGSGAGGVGGGGGAGPARNPFQATLETYHAPTQVNASSNF